MGEIVNGFGCSRGVEKGQLPSDRTQKDRLERTIREEKYRQIKALMSHMMKAPLSDPERGVSDKIRSIRRRHLCSIYRDRKEQFSLAADFMLDGLKKRYRCIYIVDENTKDGVLSALREKEGRDDGSMLDNLMFLTKEDSYLKDGSFDPDRMIKSVKEMQESAFVEGFTALRGAAEMTWIFSKLPGVEKLLEYEAKLNYFLPNSKIMIICQYNENRFDAKTLMGVLNTHPVVGIYGELFENPYYIPPDVYLASLIGEVPVAMYEKARDEIINKSSVTLGKA